MDKPKDFAEDLDALVMNVDNDVGRFVRILRDTGTSSSHVATTVLGAGRAEEPTKSGSHRIRSRRSAVVAPRVQSKPGDRNAGMVNVTTRLSVEVNERLSDSALRQRLAKKTPNNRQDIIGAALCEWFRHNGYDKSD